MVWGPSGRVQWGAAGQGLWIRRPRIPKDFVAQPELWHALLSLYRGTGSELRFGVQAPLLLCYWVAPRSERKPRKRPRNLPAESAEIVITDLSVLVSVLFSSSISAIGLCSECQSWKLSKKFHSVPAAKVKTSLADLIAGSLGFFCWGAFCAA